HDTSGGGQAPCRRVPPRGGGGHVGELAPAWQRVHAGVREPHDPCGERAGQADGEAKGESQARPPPGRAGPDRLPEADREGCRWCHAGGLPVNYSYQTPRRVTVSSRQSGELPTGDLLREVRATERQRVINEVLDALESVE